MNSTRACFAVAALLLLPAQATAQSFSIASSKWGASNANSFYDASVMLSTPGLVMSTATPGGTTAFGMVQSITDGYVFGFANTVPGAVSTYNLASTGLTAGTSLHLVFTGFSAAPKYIAYTGGGLTGYSYNGGTLTLDVTTINPVASGCDPTGNTLASVFGMKIATSGSFNYTGTVFRSDMWWGDINPMNLSYTGSPAAGVNASGVNGVLATFNAYMPTSFLGGMGIAQPADAAAYIQKSSGAGINLPLAQTFFDTGGLDPGFSNGTYTFGGTSNFDFNGGGSDNYAIFTYANSSWSDGNIGIAAIPEPGTFALGAGLLVLSLVALRRRLSSA